MDTLTHALLGLSVGALRRPDGTRTDRAVLLGCVIAAELPDLDYLWPAGDAVMRALQAHRGPSHALLAAPLVALVAAGIARLVLRGARFAPIYVMSLCAVVFAHLLPDLWTGWGTRLFIPLDDARLALDWTMVLDPFFTLPLLAGAIWGWRRRAAWRRPVLIGLAIALAYLGARIVMKTALTARIPGATVFPTMLGVRTWRFVIPEESGYEVGQVALGGALVTEGRHLRGDALTPEERALPELREALSWARFPVIHVERAAVTTIRIADLRYHLGGNPTLELVFELSGGRITKASMLRGGSFAELLRRWRGP